MAGRYVEKGDLIGAGVVVALRDFNGIASIAYTDEINAFDDPSLIYIKAGNDPLCQH